MSKQLLGGQHRPRVQPAARKYSLGDTARGAPRASLYHGQSLTGRFPFAFSQMSVLPQREPEGPAPCPGAQTLQSGAVGGARPGGPSEPLAKLCGESAPVTVSSPGSLLSSRGRTIKWFWDSAEEGYRTYHMDEYDEEKNPGVSGTHEETMWGGENWQLIRGLGAGKPHSLGAQG